MDSLTGMRAFIAVAEAGSFTGAGQRLGISTKMVSKHVARLEDRLAAQLFNRTTRSVALTELGAAYLERCRPLMDGFDELDDLIRERQTALSGPIRMTAPTGFGSTHLVRALRPFLAAHPAVEIDLRLTDIRIALVEEGIDLAIRIGRLRDSALVVRKLADIPVITCAAPSYLRERGWPRHPRELGSHECLIDGNVADPTLWRFRAGGEEIAVPVRGRFRANAPLAIAEMATGGLGIAQCPAYTVAPSLADGRLEALLEDYAADDFGLYALYPPNRHLTARVRGLIDHLTAAFRQGFAAKPASESAG